MFANRKQAPLLSWIVVVMVAVTGIILFAVMWLRPRLGDATEGWKPMNDQVSQLLETESRTSVNSEPNKKELEAPTSDQTKAAQANKISSSKEKMSGESQQGEKQKQPDSNNQPKVSSMPTTNQQHDQHGASKSLSNENKETITAATNGNNAPSNATDMAQGQQSQLISLNHADEQQLDELPGVGPSKAKAIVAYREKHGKFSAIDEVMKVKGIGPKMFKKMKDRITVD
ncbi:helix-hairpin-helix domain-containing protein [Paenibacillus sp. SC116]|uniref:ComEA family DNA-binding protein n=1 Tax=Paenibacillus sp. SC116 TaxID=2968986 RepID=UPI00215AFBE2|nr:helix-hairpin-helix domain-containing protein [Paenibacillus sp. SC116]MCR8845844.1 helix-hairpin-helix domain-containing protein [Paenibacillus sp. SC116]